MKTTRRGNLPIAIMAWAASLMICGCIQQDPFADKDESVRNARPKVEKPADERPISSEELRIEAADFYTFKEGEPGEASFSGRILSSTNSGSSVLNEDYTLRVLNLEDFPGAQFDEQTAKFTWTPPERHVDKVGTPVGHLDLEMSTLSSPLLVRRKSIPLFVERWTRDPVIESVEDLARDFIREGEIREFSVIVKDDSSLDRNDGAPGLSVVGHQAGRLNITGLVSIDLSPSNPSRDENDPSLWHFKLTLDLRNQNITGSEDRFSFALVALSQAGRYSAPKAVSARIRTDLQKPIAGLVAPMEVAQGDDVQVAFSVLDPRSEGRLRGQLMGCADLPGETRCQCDLSSGTGRPIQCAIFWRVDPSTEAGATFTVRGAYTNTHPKIGDTYVSESSSEIRFRVKEAPAQPMPVSQPEAMAASDSIEPEGGR